MTNQASQIKLSHTLISTLPWNASSYYGCPPPKQQHQHGIPPCIPFSSSIFILNMFTRSSRASHWTMALHSGVRPDTDNTQYRISENHVPDANQFSYSALLGLPPKCQPKCQRNTISHGQLNKETVWHIPVYTGCWKIPSTVYFTTEWTPYHQPRAQCLQNILLCQATGQRCFTECNISYSLLEMVHPFFTGKAA